MLGLLAQSAERGADNAKVVSLTRAQTKSLFFLKLFKDFQLVPPFSAFKKVIFLNYHFLQLGIKQKD